jgi:hypothetical protein
MESSIIVEPLLLGGLLGLIGQSIRVIVGLKKAYDVTVQEKTNFKDTFDSAQLLISLLIGFVAGTIGVLVQLDFKVPFSWSKEIAIGIIGIGYAGTDFIEGFIKKYLPGTDGKAATANNGATDASIDDIVG